MGRRLPAHVVETELAAGRVAHHLTAERDGGELVAEADPERRHTVGGRFADQLLDRRQPR